MSSRWALPIGAAAILVVAACGGPGATPSATPTPTAAPVVSPTPTPAALRIEVELTDALTIEPSQMTVPRGLPVTFVVRNSGALDHEFYLGDASMQAEHADEMAEMGGMMGHDEENGIAVDPGETKELTYTFEAAGEWLAGCHVNGHYAAGMLATITITDYGRYTPPEYAVDHSARSTVELNVLESSGDVVRAGYDCPCGCTPSLAYDRGGSVVRDDCCCGNTFALGPDAARGLGQRPGFIPEHQALVAPWSQPLQAAWLVGPSRHGSEAEHGRDDRAHGATATTAIDPACGMTIKIDLARAAGLHAQHEGTDYYFCGRGCLLDFGEDPQHFLAAGYLPSM